MALESLFAWQRYWDVACLHLKWNHEHWTGKIILLLISVSRYRKSKILILKAQENGSWWRASRAVAWRLNLETEAFKIARLQLFLNWSPNWNCFFRKLCLTLDSTTTSELLFIARKFNFTRCCGGCRNDHNKFVFFDVMKSSFEAATSGRQRSWKKATRMATRLH